MKKIFILLFVLISHVAFAGEQEIARFNCSGAGNMSQANDPLDDIELIFTIDISNVIYPSGNSELYFKVGGKSFYVNGWKKGSWSSWGMVNTSGSFDEHILNVRGYRYYAKKNDFLNSKFSEEQKQYVGSYYNESDGQHFAFSCAKQK